MTAPSLSSDCLFPKTDRLMTSADEIERLIQQLTINSNGKFSKPIRPVNYKRRKPKLSDAFDSRTHQRIKRETIHRTAARDAKYQCQEGIFDGPKGVYDNIERIARGIESIGSLAETLNVKVSEWFDGHNFTNTILLVLLEIASLYQRFSLSSLLMTVVKIFLFLKFDIAAVIIDIFTCIKRQLARVAQFISTPTAPQMQNQEGLFEDLCKKIPAADHAVAVGSVVSFTLVSLSAFILGKKTGQAIVANPDTVDALAKRLRNLKSIGQGAEYLYDVFGRLREYLVFIIKRQLSSSVETKVEAALEDLCELWDDSEEDMQILFCARYRRHKETLFASIMEFMSVESHNKIALDRDTYYRFKEIYFIFTALQVHLSGTKDPALSNFVRLTFNELHTIDTKVAHSPFSPTVRPTPFWIYIYGDTRVGKSSCVPFLNSYLLHHLHQRFPDHFKTASVEEEVMFIQTNTMYMDNYRGQPVAIIDDIFQRRDAVGVEGSEASNMINWVTNTKTHIVAAAIENKFRPMEARLFITTANVYDPPVKSITFPDALFKRRHLVLRMEQCDVEDPLLSSSGTSRSVRFQRVAATGNRDVGLPMSGAEMCKLALSEFYTHHEKEEKLVKASLNTRGIVSLIDSNVDAVPVVCEPFPHPFVTVDLQAVGPHPEIDGTPTLQPTVQEQEGYMDPPPSPFEGFLPTVPEYVPPPCPINHSQFGTINWIEDYLEDVWEEQPLCDCDYSSLHHIPTTEGITFGCNDDPSHRSYLLPYSQEKALASFIFQTKGFWCGKPAHGDWANCNCFVEGDDEAVLYHPESAYHMLRKLEFQGPLFPRTVNMYKQAVRQYIHNLPERFEAFIQVPREQWSLVRIELLKEDDEDYYVRDANLQQQEGWLKNITGWFAKTIYRPHVRDIYAFTDVDSNGIHWKPRNEIPEDQRKDYDAVLAYFDKKELTFPAILAYQERQTNLNLSQRATAMRNWVADTIKAPLMIAGILGAIGAGALIVREYLKSKYPKQQALKYSTKSVPLKRIPVYSYSRQQGLVEDEDAAIFLNELDRVYVKDVEDNATFEFVKHRIFKRRALVMLEYNISGEKFKMQGFRIGGSFILVPKHFFTFAKAKGLKNGSEFEITMGLYIEGEDIQTKTYTQIFNESLLRCNKETDYAIYKAQGMASAMDSYSQFPTRSHAPCATNCLVASLFPSTMLMTNLHAKPVGRAQSAHRDMLGNIVTVPESYHINMANRNGMCGSIALRLDNTIQPKIIGMHIAGLPGGGLATYIPIYREDLLEMVNSFDFEPSIDEVPCDIPLQQHEGMNTEPLQYRGKLQYKSDFEAPQEKTNILPSVIHDRSRCVTQPAVLHPYDPRLNAEMKGEPLLLVNMQGYNRMPGKVNTETLKEVEEVFKIDCIEKITISNKRVLTLHEVINGIQGSYKSMEMKTSAGHRYKKLFPRSVGKTALFTKSPDDDQVLTAIPMLDEDYRRCLKLIQSGTRPFLPAYACLKDERRKEAKIKSGTTRTFIVMDVVYNMLMRAFFGAFTAAQHAQAGKIPSSVGLDSTAQFGILYERLMSVGQKTEDYDYANWDRSLHPEFIRAYGRVVSHWYGDEPDSPNAIARTVLLEMLIQTDIIIRDKLYRKNIGICSGCAITAEINCIIHTMLVYYQFIECAKRFAPHTPWDFGYFQDRVQYAVYGDDIVITRADELDWFNGNNIAIICDELGMKITPADKGDHEFRSKNISECQFLKRRFAVDSRTGLVMAPLDLQVVKEIPEWIHKCSDPVLATEQNLDTSIREAFFHGKAIFQTILSDYNTRILSYNEAHPNSPSLRSLTYSYESLYARWLNEGSPLTWTTVTH